MKAVVLTLGCVVLLLNNNARADLLGLTLSGDYAKLSPSGQGGDHLFSQPLQFSDDGWQSWSVAFEHPLPLVPNVALRRQTARWSGTTLLQGNFRLDAQHFASQSHIQNALDLQSTDVSFYYEVLDNSLLALDLGVSAMQYDAELAVTEPVSRTRTASGFLPLLYSHLTINVWGTDTALFWQGQYTDYRDQQWAQTKVGLSYQMLDLTAMTLAIKFGWQQQSVALIDKDQLDIDMQMKGPFLALEADF
ncbi:TIGR04219 family outer membrane beta-barrel protein [Rheinheimera riviphila]|uniref:TIGR04219 family outer membrane beta-barrel protein n=1 Tax=Rheinheimera riviphila TaxID=1834037 RepID=A0A437QF87_9GAMM|nr:TIGR04219 family outer membrane beta-barrel protein [Rheinheimera riviphila]RVU33194.1 TIGR04219 family outer membrane beta-barrel protein [Rheinheimera riviphila]